MLVDFETVLQALHDSEINGSVEWFFDRVWTAKLGDPLNVIEAEETFDSLTDAVRWLVDKAAELYPNSDFAKQFVR